jgi:hypothetical protein
MSADSLMNEALYVLKMQLISTIDRHTTEVLAAWSTLTKSTALDVFTCASHCYSRTSRPSWDPPKTSTQAQDLIAEHTNQAGRWRIWKRDEKDPKR